MQTCDSTLTATFCSSGQPAPYIAHHACAGMREAASLEAGRAKIPSCLRYRYSCSTAFPWASTSLCRMRSIMRCNQLHHLLQICPNGQPRERIYHLQLTAINKVDCTLHSKPEPTSFPSWDCPETLDRAQSRRSAGQNFRSSHRWRTFATTSRRCAAVMCGKVLACSWSCAQDQEILPMLGTSSSAIRSS